MRGRGLRLVGLAVLIGAAVAFGISRIDVDNALREVTLPLRHDDIIREESAQRDLDPALVAAVIYAESRFRDQTSSAGARGLMQITPDTASKVAELSGGSAFTQEDLADPDINIAYGCFWLRHLFDRFADNEVAALAGYNAGPENVERWGGSELSVNQIGFPETKAYVKQILAKREEYRRVYADDLGL